MTQYALSFSFEELENEKIERVEDEITLNKQKWLLVEYTGEKLRRNHFELACIVYE